MKIRGFQPIQQCEVSTATLVKALNLIWRYAAFGVNEFHPAMVQTLQNFQCPKWRASAADIQPVQKFLKVCVDCQRPWLINKPEARTELQQKHAAASSMAVSRAAVHFNQDT